MEIYENRRYLVIPISEISNIDFNEVQETSSETLRKSIDGKWTFVKYDINIVEEDYIKTTKDPITNEEIKIDIKSGVYGRPSFYKEEYIEYDYEDFIYTLNTNIWNNNQII